MSRAREEPEDIMSPADILPLTPECKHYQSSAKMPPHLAKYWYQRLNLWRYYDHDIYMTDDAWFGVTAEPIAEKIAEELALKSNQRTREGGDDNDRQPRVIVDLFAGAGGNTIAFARNGHWDHVVGVELDPATLACAQHNADVYGVSDRITWVNGDCVDFLARLRERPWTLDPDLRLYQYARDALEPDAAPSRGIALAPLVRNVELFASPPWGGPDYSSVEIMDLNLMEPYGVDFLHDVCRPMAHALFLPRNGDMRQLADLVPDEGQKIDVVQYCINGASKGLVAYFPKDEKFEAV